jgi:glutathione peroxidase
MEKQNIYQFKVEDLSGNTFDFSTLKGKKVMIVNTASKCGLTPQYKDLEAIYKEYKDQNFVIIGFPANNFGSQEPGTNEEIASFSNKIMVLLSHDGQSIRKEVICINSHKKSKNGLEDSDVAWNFKIPNQ